MVGPNPVDPKIRPRFTFSFKPQPRQQARAALILWAVVGHDSVQLHGVEHMGNRRRQRFMHQALALCGFSERVTQVTGLKRTAHDVAEVAGADDLVLAEYQQVQRFAAGGFVGHGVEAFDDGVQFKKGVVTRRLPRLQKGAILQQVHLQGASVGRVGAQQ